MSESHESVGEAHENDDVLDTRARLTRHLVRIGGFLNGAGPLPAQHRLTRWLCLRLIGISALCAFLSLYAQLDGLVPLPLTDIHTAQIIQ